MLSVSRATGSVVSIAFRSNVKLVLKQSWGRASWTVDELVLDALCSVDYSRAKATSPP